MLNANKVVKIIKVFTITGKHLKQAYKPDCNIENLKKSWSHEIILLFNLKIKVLGIPISEDGPHLLVGNHVSYLDIPVLFFLGNEINFVSKSEVKSWPIIGQAAIKGRTIFVERSNDKSRNTAKNQIAKSLIENKQNVVIFPSGTTSLGSSMSWKKGAFEIAEINNIKLQPFRIKYMPQRAAAYIDKDNFLFHMYQILRLKEINVTVEFHPPVTINNSVEDCAFWKNWCEQ